MTGVCLPVDRMTALRACGTGGSGRRFMLWGMTSRCVVYGVWCVACGVGEEGMYGGLVVAALVLDWLCLVECVMFDVLMMQCLVFYCLSRLVCCVVLCCQVSSVCMSHDGQFCYTGGIDNIIRYSTDDTIFKIFVTVF
jgi:hypothetical protein